MDLPNFEHVPHFEHHVNKGFSKSTSFKLVNLVHEDLCRLVDEIFRVANSKFFVYIVFKISYMFKVRQIHSMYIIYI